MDLGTDFLDDFSKKLDKPEKMDFGTENLYRFGKKLSLTYFHPAFSASSSLDLPLQPGYQ